MSSVYAFLVYEEKGDVIFNSCIYSWSIYKLHVATELYWHSVT
jgi:hypothetical protein